MSGSLVRRWLAHGGATVGLLACAALVLWPPDRFGVWPACPIRQYLGVLCPGCGATRALAALLRGRIGEALHWNALFVLLLPVALAGAVRCYRRALRPGVFLWPQLSAPVLTLLLATTFLVTLARNLGSLSLPAGIRALASASVLPSQMAGPFEDFKDFR